MQNKIELHVHMDGSLPTRTLNTLVERNYHVLTDVEKRLYEAGTLYQSISATQCNSLGEYLQKFDLPCRLMQNPKDVETVFEDLVCDLANQGVIYAEIRFAPQLHSVNIPAYDKMLHEQAIVEAAISGVQRGRNDKNIIVNIILCCMRNLPEKNDGILANARTFSLVQTYLNKGVCAIDLAGAEARDATSAFTPIFGLAKDLQIPFTVHAGESGSPSWMCNSLRSAIDFGTTRIGHGVGLRYSTDLINEVKEKGITLECCLKSNIDTSAVSSLAEHPIKALFDNGVRVTLNTDNMTVSNTTLAHEYELAASLGFTVSDIAKMQSYAFDAAFMTEAQRKQVKEWMN